MSPIYLFLIFLINVHQYFCQAIQISCPKGYMLFNDQCILQNSPQCKCKNATKNCVGFNKKLGKCYECDFGYKVDENGRCIAVNYGDESVIGCCKSWDCVNLTCILCCPKWYKTDSGICRKIDPGCSVYNTNNGDCYRCLFGYLLIVNKCFQIPGAFLSSQYTFQQQTARIEN